MCFCLARVIVIGTRDYLKSDWQKKQNGRSEGVIKFQKGKISRRSFYC